MRRVLFSVAIVIALALAGGLAAYRYLESAAFQQRAEAAVLQRIAGASGARVEIGGFHFGFRPLTIDMEQVTLRGREGAGQAPLAVIPNLRLRLRLRSLWRAQVDLESMWLGTPRFHVFAMGEHGTNLPLRPAAANPNAPSLALGMDTFTVANGVLDFQDQRIPLNLALRDVGLVLHASVGNTLDGDLHFQGGQFQYDGWQPLQPAVTARFSVQGDAVAIQQLAVRDANTELDLQGAVQDLRQPSAAGTYHLEADAGRWSRLLGWPQPAAGHMAASGNWQWAATRWGVQAKFVATGLRLAGAASAGTWQAAGELQASAAGLTIPQVAFTGPAGTVRVQATYAHWNALRVNARMSGARLSALLPLLSPAAVDPRLLGPLRGFEARLDGTAQFAASGGLARLAAGSRGLSVTLASEPSSPLLPLSGRIEAHSAGATWEVPTVALQAPGLSLTAQGEIGGTHSSIRFHADSNDLRQVRSWLTPWLPGDADLATLAGAGSLDGALAGTVPNASLEARIQGSGVHYGSLRADTITAAFTLSPRQLTVSRLDWRLSGQQASGSGQLDLDDYSWMPNSAVQATVQGRGLDLRTLQQMAGLDYPVGGSVALQASVSGTRHTPAARGRLQIEQAHWQQQPLRSISADFTLADQVWSANNLTVTLGRTQIAGRLRVDTADQSYQVDLASPDVQLSEVAQLQSPRLAITGQARFHLTGSGTRARPQATLTLALANLRGGSESLGAVAATAQLNGDQVQVHATDTLPNGDLGVQATVATTAPYPIDARLDLNHYDFDALLRRFTPAELTGHSQASGSATLRGPLARPDELQAHLALDPIEVAVSGLTVHNQGPVEFDITRSQLQLLPAHIVAPETDFTLQGSVSLPDVNRLPALLAARMQANLRGTINLALIHTLAPSVRAGGQIQVAALASGTLAQPQVNGTLAIQGGSLAEDNLPIAFDAIEGQLKLTGTRVEIVKLTADTGGGQLAVTGFAGRAGSGYNFDLGITGKNLRLRYQGISATGDLQLRLSGQRSTALLAGDAQLNRIAMAQDFDLAVFIANTQTPSPPAAADSPLNRVRLDVHLTTGPQVELTTNEAQMELQGDLRLRGSLARPAILGRATAANGRLLFAGNEYEVDKAQVQFVNPFRIEPVLDVGLSTTVQQYDVTLNVSGPVDKMSINYRSDPPLSSGDIVALLATGAPTQASAALSQAAASSVTGQSEQLLGQALNNIVAGRLQRLFGITQVQVNPNNGTVGPNGYGSTVTVQQQVSRQIKLTYIQNLSSSSQDIVQVDWAINKELGATLMRDQFGLYGLKFTFRQRVR